MTAGVWYHPIRAGWPSTLYVTREAATSSVSTVGRTCSSCQVCSRYRNQQHLESRLMPQRHNTETFFHGLPSVTSAGSRRRLETESPLDIPVSWRLQVIHVHVVVFCNEGYRRALFLVRELIIPVITKQSQLSKIKDKHIFDI